MFFQRRKQAKHCIVCADTLHPAARKCVKCGSWQDGRSCSSCGAAVAKDTIRCTTCNTFLSTRRCRSCGDAIPEFARRCAACSSFQDVRRFIPSSQIVLALLVSVLSVSTAFVPLAWRAWNYRSRTHAVVLGAAPGQKDEGERVLLLAITNDGGRPATIGDRVRLRWDVVPIKPQELYIINVGERVVLPYKTSVLRLSATGLGLVDDQVTESTFVAAVKRGKARLTFDVEQTARDGSRWEEKDVEIEAMPHLLVSWVRTLVQIPPDPDSAAPAAAGGGGGGATPGR